MKNYGVNGRSTFTKLYYTFLYLYSFLNNNYAFYYIHTFWENFPKEFLKQWENIPINLTSTIKFMGKYSH